jgi:hypothetical protein
MYSQEEREFYNEIMSTTSRDEIETLMFKASEELDYTTYQRVLEFKLALDKQFK